MPKPHDLVTIVDPSDTHRFILGFLIHDGPMVCGQDLEYEPIATFPSRPTAAHYAAMEFPRRQLFHNEYP